jgi:hypothetical protein
LAASSLVKLERQAESALTLKKADFLPEKILILDFSWVRFYTKSYEP